MAINKKLFKKEEAAAPAAGSGNQEEGLILHLDANDVDSYDGDGTEWVDIANHEYKPATNPSEHFNTVLFSPTSSGITSITGVGFQPDLVWTKNRDNTWFHQLYDSVRGGGKNLYPNDTYAENSPSLPTSHLDSIDSDGFTVDYSENIGNNHVAWCFKSGGAPSGSDKVSIDGTSYATMTAAGLTDGTAAISKLSANTKLGFSIIESDTGITNNSQTKTIAHGLGVKPEIIITKILDSDTNWWVSIDGITGNANDYLGLNLNDAKDNIGTSYPFGQATSSVFSVNGAFVTGRTIFYCFTSKRGVSKVGSYTGTGAAGNKVYTGFEPAWVMVKRTDAAQSWGIYDNKRVGSSETPQLLANSSLQEYEEPLYFERDGFRLDGSETIFNGSGGSYIYLAFAKDTNETQLTPEKGDFVAEDTVTTGAVLELDANDYSGSGNWLNTGDDAGGDGTITGAGYQDDGTQSDYFNFDGNDQVTFTLNTFPTTTFTIEAWVYFNSLGTYGIVNWGDESTGERRSLFLWNGGSGDYKLYFSGYYSAANVGANTSINANTWYHLAVSCDNGSIKLYVNGVNDGGGDATLNSFTGTTGRIGNTGSDEYLNGRVGIARIYDSVLTGSEIKSNYDATYGFYQNAGLEQHLDAASFPQKGESGYSNTPTTWTALTGSNGTITGATFDSELGNCLDFDGVDDIVDMGTTVAKQVGMTYEMWFSLDSASTRYGLFSNYTTVGGNKGLTIRHVETGKMQIDGYGTGGVSNRMFRQFDTSLVANKWYHLAMVVTSSSATCYINGEEQTQTNDSNYNKHNGTVLFASAATARLGVSYETSNYLSGRIGQFRTYESELTQNQIRQNFNFTKNDYPNGFNGTITGAAFNAEGSFEFQANDYLRFPTTSPFNDSNTIKAITGWVKADTTSSRVFLFNVSSTSNTSDYFYFSYQADNNQIVVHTRDGSSSNQSLDIASISGDTNWNHIVVQLTDTDREIYLNGTKLSTTLTTAGTGTATSWIDYPSYASTVVGELGRLRAASPLSSHYSDCKISKVKLYDKVLTQAEITALYNEGE